MLKKDNLVLLLQLTLASKKLLVALLQLILTIRLIINIYNDHDGYHDPQEMIMMIFIMLMTSQNWLA